MTIRELREILLREAIEDDDWASKEKVFSALGEWTSDNNAENKAAVSPRVINGIRLLMKKQELLEPVPEFALHRGITMSKKQLARWLQTPEEDMGTEGQVKVNGSIVIGKEGPTSWSHRSTIAVGFATSRTKDGVAHRMNDPVSAVFTTRAALNPGVFVDLCAGPNFKQFNSFIDEKEALALSPVKVEIVTWIDTLPWSMGSGAKAQKTVDDYRKSIDKLKMLVSGL